MTLVTDTDDAMVGYSSFDPDREEQLEPGQLVAHGRYRVVRMLGRGGVAIVYEATDTRSTRNVALKVVTSKYADKSETYARYHNEARLAAAIGRHPNVVCPIEIGRIPEFQRRLYLATELVHGRSVGKIMLHHTRGMEIPRACRIGRDVARALCALHGRGIVHRDIKPDNIMLEDDSEVAKLLDFGFAYALGESDTDVQASPDLTQAHERPGTPIYMAPEQAVGLRPALAFDLYALGASLYEMVTGTAPYAGGSTVEVVQRKCARNDPPPAVELLREDLPPKLASLVGRCLSREPDGRPTIETALAELEQLCETSDKGTTQRTQIAESEPKRELNAVQSPLGRLLSGGTAATAARPKRGHTEVAGQVIPATAFAQPTALAPAITVPAKSGRSRATAIAAFLLGSTGLMTWFVWPTPAPQQDSSQSPSSTGVSAPSTRDRHEAPPPPAPTPLKPSPPAPAEHKPLPAVETSNPVRAAEATTGHNRPEPKKKPTRAAVCDTQRSKANVAKNKRKWASVLRRTADAGCWKNSASERKRLRVEALLRLGRYQECAKESFGSKHAVLTAWRKQCVLGVRAKKLD